MSKSTSKRLEKLFKNSPCFEAANHFLMIETGRSFPERQYEISLCRLLGEAHYWSGDHLPGFPLTTLVDRGVGGCPRYEIKDFDPQDIDRARKYQDLIEKALPLSEAYLLKRAELHQLVAAIDEWPFQ